MTNKSTLDNWEEEVRNMVYEVWTSHSSSKHMVELVGKLLQAQREKDKEMLLEGVEEELLKYDISGRHYLIEQLNKVINEIYGN